jgi:hypothetical protein
LHSGGGGRSSALVGKKEGGRRKGGRGKKERVRGEREEGKGEEGEEEEGRGEEGRKGGTGTGPVIVRGWSCRAVIAQACGCEWGVCALVAIVAGGGWVVIRSCALVVVFGRVVAWWVLAAVERRCVVGVGLVFVVCGWFSSCSSSLAWGVVVGGRGMSVGDHCGGLFAVALLR